jgi:GNAT superfamily N-acetyltransferase
MSSDPRRVWRVSPPTLAVVIAFCAAAGVCVPILAYLTLVREQNPWLSAFLATLAVIALVYGWRFGLHPSVRADGQGVTVRNPHRTVRFGWSEITVLAPGENGLLIASEADRVEAWCIQKSRWATRRGRRTRADRIADELFDLLQSHDPPLEDDETGIRIRRARWHEHGLLTQIERSASKAALGHVFPPEEYPYPTAAVRRRWRRLLRDRSVHVRILEEFDIPVGLVAFESAGTLHHLAVAPQYARRGYGALLLEYATQEMFDSGAQRATLWVLVENRDARAFYRSQGWEDTMERGDCEFPPYPREMQLARANPAAPRRVS